MLDALLASALLGYLAVAHHGRGRGAWVDEAPPPRWTAAVQAALDARRSEVDAAWATAPCAARTDGDATGMRGGGAASSSDTSHRAMPCSGVLESASAEVLVRLYPDAGITLPA